MKGKYKEVKLEKEFLFIENNGEVIITDTEGLKIATLKLEPEVRGDDTASEGYFFSFEAEKSNQCDPQFENCVLVYSGERENPIPSWAG